MQRCTASLIEGHYMMKKYFNYLEALRHSGRVNMYGAMSYLQNQFPELVENPNRAKETLKAWMDSCRNGGGGK